MLARRGPGAYTCSVMAEFENLHIIQSTERGRGLLRHNDGLRRAVGEFTAAQYPHLARVEGARLLGAGRYSFTFEAMGVALKVSDRMSSQDAFDKKQPMPSEDLSQQYRVLGALHDHLQGNDDGVLTPEQFFVAHTPSDAYVLGQEYMAGWRSFSEQTHMVYDGERDDAAKAEVKRLVDAIGGRITRALGGFAYRHMVNDLYKRQRVNGGNILVPADDELSADTPICIIDQPGGRPDQWKFKETT